MLTPFVHKTALTFALAVSLSSNIIVAPLTSNGDTKEEMAQHDISSKVSSSLAAVLPFRQYDTANDIPTSYYKDKKVIRGRVMKVIDGDTLRIRHTPLYPFSKGERGCTGRKLTECTISVRLYGVDAPETAKFGNDGQPYSLEAKQYISNNVQNKVVKVKLLRKDQYSRVIGVITTRNKYIPFLKNDLSRGLAEQGYASLYTGGGAEYDGRRDELQRKIKKAQDKKKGIWSNGVDNFVDPAAYKREIRAKKNGNGR